MIDHYDWAGGREAMVRFGPDTGPVVMMVLPVLEEANRMRTFAVTMLRMLAERGVASALPDLPGQGESCTRLEGVTLNDWQEAVSCCVRHCEPAPVHLAAIRSGVLLTHRASAASRWFLAPQEGARLTRELERTRIAAGGTPGGDPVEIAGNLLSRDLLTALGSAVPDATAPQRRVRLDSDNAPANRHVPGAPLWRASEPGADNVLAAVLADDLAEWIGRCAA